MNEINNNLVAFQKGFLVDEILNISSQSTLSENIPIICNILEINENVVTLKFDSQIIKAINSSSYPLKQGDTIVLMPIKYQDSKVFYKIVDFVKKEDNTINQDAKVFNTEKLNISHSLLKIFLSLNNVKIFENKLPISIILDKPSIPADLLNFAKSCIMFIGKLSRTEQGFLLETGQKTFSIETDIFKDMNHLNFNKDMFLRFLSQEVVGIINNDETISIIPKDELLKDNFKEVIKTLFSNAKVQPKDEIDFLAMFNLLLDKKPINREEFMRTKIKLNQFIEKIENIFDTQFSADNKQKVNIKESVLSNKDVFLLFKLFEKEDGLEFTKIDNMLNQFVLSTKMRFQFDFGYYLIDVFKLKWDINQKTYDVNVFINNKKGSKFKANSLMIKLSTDNLGNIGIYLKKIFSNSFKSIFVSDRLSTIDMLKNNHGMLINSLKSKGYTLEIEYKFDNIRDSNIIFDYLQYEIDMQKIDLRV